jgi:acetyl esterase/lipase
MAHVLREPDDLLRLADIHPEMVAYLEKHSSDKTSSAGMEELRAAYTAMNERYLESLGPDTALGVRIKNRTVLARDGYDIPIRTYHPAEATEPGPLIVFIHGGGQCAGSLVDEEGHCRLFVKELGASCVNIDYRLAPEHPQPIQVNDCWDVTKWAATHAAELGANPAKGFIIGGISAGALNADIIARLSRDEKLEPPVTGQLQIATMVCDPSMIPERYRSQFLSWDQEMSGSLPRGALAMFRVWQGADPKDQWTSPMVAWPTGNKGIPRTVLMVHGRDLFRDVGLIYERILREEVGVETKLYLYPGLPHGFNISLAGGNASKQHLKDMLDGLRWLIAA